MFPSCYYFDFAISIPGQSSSRQPGPDIVFKDCCFVSRRFLFILLGPLGKGPQYHEIGRSIATLMTDEVKSSFFQGCLSLWRKKKPNLKPKDGFICGAAEASKSEVGLGHRRILKMHQNEWTWCSAKWSWIMKEKESYTLCRNQRHQSYRRVELKHKFQWWHSEISLKTKVFVPDWMKSQTIFTPSHLYLTTRAAPVRHFTSH